MGSRAAIVVNRARPGVEETIRRLVELLAGRGWSAAAEPGTIQTYGIEAEPLAEGDPVDLVVTLGGDGTLLSAARRWGTAGAPIFGVNLGGLGFLTAATPETMEARIGPVLDGTAPIQRRMTLAAEVAREGGTVPGGVALNDAVIHKGPGLRVLRMSIAIDGDPVGSYLADGLILSTPTGATGYSLSAGGPVAVPGVDAILVTPICAHALAVRPIVAAGDARIEVRVDRGRHGMALVLDGQVDVPLETGDVVRVRRSERTVTLAGLDRGEYFERLRETFDWGGRSR